MAINYEHNKAIKKLVERGAIIKEKHLTNTTILHILLAQQNLKKWDKTAKVMDAGKKPIQTLIEAYQ